MWKIRMASGAEHEVEIAERDRLLAVLDGDPDVPKPAWVTLQTRGPSPKEPVEVHLNVALVESVTKIPDPANQGWIPLIKKK